MASCNVFLIGPMGVGKSTIGKQLAKELKLDFFDSDQEIERRTGADIPWIFDVEGEEGFRLREERIIEELTALPNIVLATGGGAVESAKNRSVLAARGMVIYLKASLEQQIQRTSKGRNRPLLLTEDPQSVIKELEYKRGPLYEELADWTVTTDGNNIKSTVNEIVKHILSKKENPLA
ncbi:MAG: shikimate kinase AroK [Gammaproteobacteria bacterium]|nr:shikimate kinase AroK [Gammaproteobacteria bacterium]